MRRTGFSAIRTYGNNTSYEDRKPNGGETRGGTRGRQGQRDGDPPALGVLLGEPRSGK